MPLNCNVIGCKTGGGSDRNIRFFRLPPVCKSSKRLEKLTRKRRAAWIQVLGGSVLGPEPLVNLRICSKHFVQGRPAALYDETNVDWIPNKNMYKAPKNIKMKRQTRNPISTDKHEVEIVRVEDLSETEREMDETDDKSNVQQYIKKKKKKTVFNDDKNMDAIPKKEKRQTRTPGIIEKLEIEIVRAEVFSEQEEFPLQIDEKNPITEEHEREKKSNTPHFIKKKKKKRKKKIALNEEQIMDWITSENMFKARKNTKKKKQIRIPKTKHKHEIEFVGVENGSEIETLQMEVDGNNLIIEKYESEKKQLDGKLKKVINDYEEQLKEKDQIIEQITRQLTILHGLKLLEANDEKIKYFTGIPDFKLLTALFSYIEDEVCNLPPHDIDHFEGFILTLTKLRLDLPFQYLSYKYGVPYAKVTKIFHKHINAMNKETTQFIKWPNKYELNEYMPAFYTKFIGLNLVVIIHPLQIVVHNGERYSTIKYIIATSPLGDIVYVSQGFSAQCNDRAIVETCGIIDHLEVDDVVLFLTDMLVNEVVLFKGRKLLAYPRKRNDEHEVLDVITKCRNRENLRMELEKVVALVQENFPILDHRQPVALYKNHENKVCIDNVVKVCCALVNLDPTILGSVKLPEFIGKLKIR